MSVMSVFRAFALCLPLAWTAAANAQSGEEIKRLDGEELRGYFADRTLMGCYPDGSPWWERTTADGRLYDLFQGDGGSTVGSWWVQGDQVCYAYDAAPDVLNPSCFTVARRGRHLDFFLAGTLALGGTTDCEDEIASVPSRPA